MIPLYRYLLFTSYVGTRYLGSQRVTPRTANNPEVTIQEALEASLAELDTRNEVRITSSSRTDRGVHSICNPYTATLEPKCDTGYFSTHHVMDTCNLYLSRNRHEIKLNKVILVPNSFHPQAHAEWREYIYRVASIKGDVNSITTNPLREPYILNHLLPISELYRITPLRRFDVEKAQEAIELLNGTHDFASFTSCIIDRNPKSTVRTVDITLNKGATLRNEEFEVDFDVYEIKIRSKSFLYNQIRKMVGSILCYCSYGNVKISRIKHLLYTPTTLSWSGGLVIAPPCGLYLNKVHYSHTALFLQPAKESSTADEEEDSV